MLVFFAEEMMKIKSKELKKSREDYPFLVNVADYA
tara:strand:- start:641 stop:745 length:105 start_codon:yes stop_codon:yes gene_type:complete